MALAIACDGCGKIIKKSDLKEIPGWHKIKIDTATFHICETCYKNISMTIKVEDQERKIL